MTEETVHYLASKGVHEIAVGCESGSQKMLTLMNKRTTPAQNYSALRTIKKYGIKAFTDIIFMYPGETRETIDETLRFIWATKPNYVNSWPVRSPDRH